MSHASRAASCRMLCLLFVCILCAASTTAHAQFDMQAISYNLSNVLPTDLIKTTVQDKRGFVWAASDAGLVRFDGRHSTLHRNLPSPYVKALLQTSAGETLVLTDMGLVKIREDKDSIRFPIVIPGASSKSDSTIFYAKSLFEASNGDIWIGEPDAVLRLRKSAGKLVIKRFPFDVRYTADSFNRTFSFAEEADGTIIVLTQRGQGLFRFDEALQQFEQIPVKGQAFIAASAILLTDSKQGLLWVATNNGVFETRLRDRDSERAWKQILAVRDASCLGRDQAGNIYIGTWYLGLHCYFAESKQIRALAYIDSKTINDVRMSNDGNVWISADDGITLLHPYTFFKPALPFDRPFIQQTIRTQNGDILVSDGASLLRINPYAPTMPATEILSLRNRDVGNLTTFAEHSDGSIYAASSGGFLLQILPNGTEKVVRRESSADNFYFALFSSKQGIIWGCHNPNGRLTAISPNGSVKDYDSTLGITSGVFVVRESAKQDMYAGGGGSMGYLFRYNAGRDAFENISAKLPFSVTEPFSVNDLVVESDTSIWLATTYGMVYYHNGKADTIPLSGEIARRNALSVTLAPQGGLIFATDHGVYMYVRGEIVAVDLRLEKMVMSPSYRSIVVDKATQLWLGTRSGLLLSKQFAKLVPQTQTPSIVALRANGAPITRDQREHISGLYLQAEFTALCYPAEKVRYQTRMVRVRGNGDIIDTDTLWREARYDAEEIFPSVPSGEYMLQIRAQQEGFLWSAPVNYRFSVQPAWYIRWWAILLYLAAIIGLMFLAARLWAYRLARKNRALKKIVEERTQEIQRQVTILDEQAREIELANTRLQEQNVQLIDLNREKNDFLGIAAHDLKNPLTGIMMTVSTMRNYYDRMSRDDVQNQLLRVEQTSKRMHGIITELLDVNAIETGTLPLHLSDFDIAPILRQVTEDFQARASAKDIALHLDIDPETPSIHADSSAVVQVLENIVSNAIKYSPNGKNVFVSLAPSSIHAVRIAVRDEGPGLSEEDKGRLFEKFAKLSARPTAGESSTGLGLSIVKRMMEGMKGQVRCESTIGEGATFILEFAASRN